MTREASAFQKQSLQEAPASANLYKSVCLSVLHDDRNVEMTVATLKTIFQSALFFSGVNQTAYI